MQKIFKWRRVNGEKELGIGKGEWRVKNRERETENGKMENGKW